MATRSLIGIENKDGTVEFISNHHDGYLSYTGRKLTAYYKDEETIRKLLALGDLSTLGNTPVEDENGWSGFYIDDEKRKCITYRSRYDSKIWAIDVDALTVSNKEEYEEEFRESDKEFAYLFSIEKGKWMYAIKDPVTKEIFTKWKTVPHSEV